MNIWSAILCLGVTALASANADDCRCLPGDECWPSPSSWNTLNTTVGGRLIATVPIGTPCHDPHYDAIACAKLQAEWNLPQTQ